MMSCLSFRSVILWMIVICSATSNHLIVEPFVASRPMAESAFSKSASANLRLKPGRFYGRTEPVYFHTVLTHSASFSRGRVFIGSTFAQKFLEAHTESLLKRFIHSIDSRLSFSSPPCGRRLESDSICSPNEPEPLEPEQEPSEPSEPVPVPKPESELIEQEPVEPSSSRMTFAEEINIENVVEPSSSRMPKMVPNAAASMTQASQLLALPNNGRAKSNQLNKYNKELSRGGNVEAIINYGYSYDETISSPATSGNSQMTIPLQVCEGESYSKQAISSQLSIQDVPGMPSIPSRLSNTVSSKDAQNKIKMKMPRIQIPQSEYFNSAVNPEISATSNPLPSNCEGDNKCLPSSLRAIVAPNCEGGDSVCQVSSEHLKCVVITQLPLSTKVASTKSQVYCRIPMSNDPLPSHEGDCRVQQTTPSHLRLIVESHPVPSFLQLIVEPTYYCGPESSNIRMRFRSKCQRPISCRASAYDKMNQASRKVKEKGLAHHAAIRIDPIHTISSLSNPSLSVCEGEKSVHNSVHQILYQTEYCGLKEQGQQIKNACDLRIMQMQSIFGSCNYIDGHANHTSESYHT